MAMSGGIKHEQKDEYLTSSLCEKTDDFTSDISLGGDSSPEIILPNATGEDGEVHFVLSARTDATASLLVQTELLQDGQSIYCSNRSETFSGQVPMIWDEGTNGQARPAPHRVLRKRSTVWNFFHEDEDERKVQCKVCDEKLSRGGTGHKATTTPMINHLRRKHPDLFSTYVDKEPEKRHAMSRDLTVVAKDKERSYDDPAVVELNYKIAEMIAVDNLPVGLVDGEGFRRLMKAVRPAYNVPSKTFFGNEVIPDIYCRCKRRVSSMIQEARYISFTTDVWSGSTNECFVGVTSHWISRDFENKHAILGASRFPGAPSGQAVVAKLQAVFREWRLASDHRHLVIRDDAEDIALGLMDAGIPSESCYLRTLHLAVEDAIKCQPSVDCMIEAAKAIVTHISQSSAASLRFKQIRKQTNAGTKQLLQHVEGRWNSTLYMLARMLELKDCVSVFASEGEIINLDDEQWNLLRGTLSVLQPLEEVTKFVSDKKSILSDVIPTTATLKRYLSKENAFHTNVRFLKDGLKKSITRRLDHAFSSMNYMKATFLDPRYKLDFFPESKREALKQAIVEELTPISDMTNSASEQTDQFTQNPGMTTPQLAEESHSSFWNCFSEIRQENQAMLVEQSDHSHDRAIIRSEISLYVSLPTILKRECPFQWWKQNASTYPNLSPLVFKYLSAPASTVFNEILYTTEGNLYEEKKNRLMPVNGDMLAFLNRNLGTLNYEYM